MRKKYILLLSLLVLGMSCSFTDSNLSHSRNEAAIQVIAKADSAKYVESILYVRLENPNDSLMSLSILKDIMSKKFIYIKWKKNEKDTIQIPLYCDNKPRNFYFYFENNQLNAYLFDGKSTLPTKINHISIGSLSEGNLKESDISFCFGHGYEEDNHFYSGCEFSGGYHDSKDFALWITPADPYILAGYITEDQMNLYKTYKVGCE